MEKFFGFIFALACIFYVIKTRKKGRRVARSSSYYHNDQYRNDLQENGPEANDDGGDDGGGDDD